MAHSSQDEHAVVIDRGTRKDGNVGFGIKCGFCSIVSNAWRECDIFAILARVHDEHLAERHLHAKPKSDPRVCWACGVYEDIFRVVREVDRELSASLLKVEGGCSNRLCIVAFRRCEERKDFISC